ncbi:translocon-associated protein subunit alpha [Chrysoperla carnea]|uniref:translocon-associated protein subunit alpha n=1 Tax=Chrysoperla carnea TaxID=189513 RepID=UPI001D08EB90|nr:translocon-associated protein subunit alpha [Chrysoperla carnea]
MKNIFLFALLILPTVILTVDNGYKYVARAEDELDEDLVAVEGENDEMTVTEDTEEEDGKTTASPDAETTILFVKPIAIAGSQLELPAGRLVEFLVGFTNKGNQDFVLETLDASFRYPMDYNFYIQNFSAIAYNRLVKPGHEASLSYSFLPSEAFAGRPFGLNINLNYRDAAGASFQEAVYNETVQIIEIEEGLDGETFFLYVFLAAGVVLLLVVGQQFLGSYGRKRTTRKPVVETGTKNPNNVDYDWLPKQTLQTLNKIDSSSKSPKAGKNSKSPKAGKQQKAVANNKHESQSPKQRKNRARAE